MNTSLQWVAVLFVFLLCGRTFHADQAAAIQKESHAEKEAHLKEQALGGLFNRWTFDQQPPNDKPVGFSAMGAGEDSGSAWVVQADPDAPSAPNVLKIESTCQSSSCYRLLVADKLQYEYPDVSVRLRFPAEATLGLGGIVIGVRDAANFYAVIVDLASKKLETIRMVDGQPAVLGQTPITPKAVDWHSLRVQRDTIISKDVINAYFDGLLVLSVQDQTFGTGQVGIMAQGKSSLLFDSLHAIPLFTQRPFSDPAAY